jgi:uncharacterized protein YbbK (DUF523 family)
MHLFINEFEVHYMYETISCCSEFWKEQRYGNIKKVCKNSRIGFKVFRQDAPLHCRKICYWHEFRLLRDHHIDVTFNSKGMLAIV